MSSWITQHFLNSALFWPGVALLAAPVIIHLINRLRFKRVRFAAMEFLLSSQKRNRRRVLLEQILLLASRVLLVLLIASLIARLILDPQHLSLFQGAKSHHVVLLDDTGSMQDRIGERTAFDVARDVVKKILAEGARRSGTQRFTLMLQSRPLETIAGMSERDIDEQFLTEALARIDDLECTSGAGPLSTALQAARSRLADDRASIKQLHVISDFRKLDWSEDQALAAELTALDQAQVNLNLVRSLADWHGNLAASELSGFVEVAAVKVPVTFQATVSNHGDREAKDVPLTVLVDGERLPVSKTIPTLAAGESVVVPFDTAFNRSGLHKLQVQLGPDSLEADNNCHLAVRVPEDNPVLIIDGTPGAEQGLYVADAIAAQRSVTGYAPIIDSPDGLRKRELDKFHLIYMVNVPELPPDAVAALEDYVRDGGGLAWFMGDAVRSDFVNRTLYRAEGGLFPVPLGPAPIALSHEDPTASDPDLLVTTHPVTAILAGEENPFVDVVKVNYYFPIAAEMPNSLLKKGSDPLDQASKESQTPEGVRPLSQQAPKSVWETVKVIARLRGGAPVLLDHSFGKGRIVTCLTTAGPLANAQGEAWNNWASGEGAVSFSVMQLELAKYIARQDRTLPRQTVGDPLSVTYPFTEFRDEIEVITPADELIKMRSAPAVAAPVGATSPNEPEASAPGATAPPATAAPPKAKPPVPSTQPPLLSAIYRDTHYPGIYTLRRFPAQGPPDESLIAFNVPPSEGHLEIASEDQLRKQLGDVAATIQAPGQFEWIRAASPGQELRTWLLWLLLIIGMAEQVLAYRCSYHPE